MGNDDQFLCNKCGKQYKHRQSYSKHMKFSICNDSAILLECKDCDKTFNIPYNLKRHAAKCKGNKENKFCCNLCNSKFRNNWFLERHRKSCNLEYFMCIQCGKEFQTKSSYKNHTKCCIFNTSNGLLSFDTDECDNFQLSMVDFQFNSSEIGNSSS